MRESVLYRCTCTLLCLFILVVGLILARSFFIPLAFAAFFASLTLPFANKLEQKGFGMLTISSTILTLIVLVLISIASLVAYQIATFDIAAPELTSKVEKRLNAAQEFIQQKLHISTKHQIDYVKERAKSLLQTSGRVIQQSIANATGGVLNSILVFVYLFLLIYYKNKIFNFLFFLTPVYYHTQLSYILTNAKQVSFYYLWGMVLDSTVLSVITTIELYLLGTAYALLWGVLAGILNFIPYIGVMVSFILPAATDFLMTGSVGRFMLIALFFSVNQLIEGNILKPYIVGSQVNLNALATVVVVVAGGLMWGIPGMILSIPLLGILKVIFDATQYLKPYGYLIGNTTD